MQAVPVGGGQTPMWLARNAIALREVLFQAVSAMAPAGALAISVAVGASYAGTALTLAVGFSCRA